MNLDDNELPPAKQNSKPHNTGSTASCEHEFTLRGGIVVTSVVLALEHGGCLQGYLPFVAHFCLGLRPSRHKHK